MTINQLEEKINSYENPIDKFTITIYSLPWITREIEAAENELTRLARLNGHIYKQLKQHPVQDIKKLRLASRLERNREKINRFLTVLETLDDALEKILSVF